MKPILLFLLFFQFSAYAQTTTENQDGRKKLYFTLINGKSGGSIKLTRNEIIDASITLKGKEENEEIPVIKGLTLYIPGYPILYIEGNEVDRETAAKIEKIRAGNVIEITPVTQIPSRITTMQIEIIE